MSKISQVEALEILDSRGNPTLQVFVTTEKGIIASASIPSGASTGSHEAIELRDRNQQRYFGKGMQKAIHYVNGPLANLLIGEDSLNQLRIDQLLIEADGTENKSHFGANSILGCSLAVAKAAAAFLNIPFFRYIGGPSACTLPCPMINIINGGAHADNLLDFQEFMIRPIGAPTFADAIRYGSEVFHHLKKILQEMKQVTAVGDEGGFAPNFSSHEQAIETILKAIEKAGYTPGVDISLALDCAASEFYDKNLQCYIEKKKSHQETSFGKKDSQEQVAYLAYLCQKYPIDSIEDGLDENDWEGWKLLSQSLAGKVQLVGDDLFVTNEKFLRKGIEQGVANSILIKPNQIGTLTETLNCIELAHTHGYTTILSHRSGETEDSFIADLAVASNAGQIKTGSVCRSERVAKYNRLLLIEHLLQENAIYHDSNPFAKKG